MQQEAIEKLPLEKIFETSSSEPLDSPFRKRKRMDNEEAVIGFLDAQVSTDEKELTKTDWINVKNVKQMYCLTL